MVACILLLRTAIEGVGNESVFYWTVIAAMGGVGLPNDIFAASIPVPTVLAGTVEIDLEDSGFFLPTDPAIGIEWFDLTSLVGAGSEFGFIFESEPDTRIPVFDASDQTSAVPGSIRFVAVVFFDTGTFDAVIDADGLSIQFYC